MKAISSAPVVAALSFVISLLLGPSVASAQGTIAGQVTDTTGAVLPGVTVEASSPALIEGTRVHGERRPGPLSDSRPAARAPTK